jgi:hypothetical protein
MNKLRESWQVVYWISDDWQYCFLKGNQDDHLKIKALVFQHVLVMFSGWNMQE